MSDTMRGCYLGGEDLCLDPKHRKRHAEPSPTIVPVSVASDLQIHLHTQLLQHNRNPGAKFVAGLAPARAFIVSTAP